MKIKNISLFGVWCCLLLSCILFIMFPVDIKFLYTWLLNNEQNTKKSIAEYENTSNTLYAVERMYHKAVLLKFSDTKSSVEIAEHLLSNTATLTRSQHISVLILLGELYYILREYRLASDVYWKVLIMIPENDTVRHNYELMVLFDEIRKSIPSKNGNNTIIKEPTDDQSNLDRLPHLLQTIQQDDDYFLHIQEQSPKSELPAW